MADPTVVQKILNHLHLPAEPPPIAAARFPAEAVFFQDDPHPPESRSWLPSTIHIAASPREPRGL